MPTFIIDDSGTELPIEAREIAEAVEEYTREYGEGWSDHVEVRAREIGARQWQVFPVTQHTEVVVDVGDPTPGPMVDDDAGAP